MAAGHEHGECGRNEAAVDIEAIASGEQSQRRLVVANFHCKRVVIGERDIRRIGNDNVELLPCNGTKQVALKKADAVGDAVQFGILTCDR